MSNHAELIRTENTGKPVTNRGRNFIEFDNGDGSARYVATIDPLHVRNSETEIDATWYPDSGAWQWRIGENDWQAHARDVFNVGSLIEWRHESGEWVIVDPQSINWVNQDYSRQQIAIKQAVTGSANDATLTFAEAYGPGKHFKYTAHPRRLIKEFVIDNLTDLPDPESWLTGDIWLEVEWTITNSAGVELYLDGVAWDRKNNVRVQTSNRIEFKTDDLSDPLWFADVPKAKDSNGDSISGQYEVMAQGGTYFIRVRIPIAWILSATFPVFVDPTFTDGYGGDVQTYKDSSINNGSPTTNYGTSQTGNVGYPGNISRFLLEFDLSSLSGVTINSATLTLTPNSVDTPGTLDGYRILTAWTEGGVTWNTVDGSIAWPGSVGCSTPGTDRASTKMFDSIGSWTGGTSKDVSLDTTETESWLTDNYGIIIQSQNESSWNNIQMASSDHTTTSYRPKLVVDYSDSGITIVMDAA